MSRTYEALRKAEKDRLPVPPNGNGNGHGNGGGNGSAPRRDPAHLEYEKIRVWLRHPSTNGNRVQTVMIVACHPGSGATTTTALLGSTLAEGKHSRVLIIDSNFRTPGMNLLFKVQNNPGLSEIATEGLPFDAQIQPTDRQNLFALSSGASSSPLDVFDSEAIDRLLAEMKLRFDFILFDAAPALNFPDSYALAAKVDGIILVVEAEGTLIEEAQRTKRDLERAGGRILGIVLNRQQDFLPSAVRRWIGA
jgi:protein-tyrosine kinase